MKMIRSHPDVQKSGTKVVAMTAHINKSDIDNFLNSGFNSCILKPYKEETLINTVCDSMGIKTLKKPAHEPVKEKPAEPLYSLKELNRLGNNNTEFVIKMIETFIKSSSEITSQMKESLLTQDWKKLSGLAHKAIPSFSFMGLNTYIDKLRFIEKNASNTYERTQIKELVDMIEKNVSVILTELNKEIYKLKTTSLN
jgi:CheY-like chemotaxis protein